MATGEPLFGWCNKSIDFSYAVRAVGGALFFYSIGLYVHVIRDASSDGDIAVAARSSGIKNQIVKEP
jgi:hypothetical protein